MSELSSKDLKASIDEFFIKSLYEENPTNIVLLDSIKSIMGMNLESINDELLNFFSDNFDNNDKISLHLKEYDNLPEAMSVFNLQSSLLAKNLEESLKNVFYLSRVSDGMQILEFLLEFSLRYCSSSFRYIWHLIKFQKFLNGKYILESLNRSIILILEDSNVEFSNNSSKDIIWDDIFSLDFRNIDEVLLFYTIYKTEMIRDFYIKPLLKSRINYMIKKTSNKNILNVKSDQLNVGRIWILNYLNSIIGKNLDSNELISMNYIRACLMLSSKKKEKQYLWSYLNNKLCN
tara:strand:- start:85 stop:954 length:870 start_codon:yes stop_codon:yes gene_type:complete